MARSEFHDAYDDPVNTRAEIFATPVSDLPLREPIMIESVATAADAALSWASWCCSHRAMNSSFLPPKWW